MTNSFLLTAYHKLTDKSYYTPKKISDYIISDSIICNPKFKTK